MSMYAPTAGFCTVDSMPKGVRVDLLLETVGHLCVRVWISVLDFMSN